MTTYVCLRLAAGGHLCVVVDAWNAKSQAFCVVPRKRRRSNLKDNANRRNESMVESALDLVSRAMERGRPSARFFNCRGLNFFSFQSRWGEPFLQFSFQTVRQGRACNHEAAVPVAQALREERTHGRSRALWEEFVKLTQVSSYLPSWEAGKDFAQPRCSPPISVHEVPVNALCSRRVMVLVLCGRAAVCLRLPSLA
jgi:hypothetical protein